MSIPNCPKCSGPMFDERKSQYWNNGKTSQGKNKPMFKCKRKGECDGVAWREDGTDATPATAAPTSPAGATLRAVPSSDRLKDIEATYDACFAAAIQIAEKYAEQYPTAIAGRLDIPAMASTMMIQAFK